MLKIEAEKVAEAYKQFKANLTAREKDIVTRYYGIAPHVRNTLAEIGEVYGVTRERIRQIKTAAIEKLKAVK